MNESLEHINRLVGAMSAEDRLLWAVREFGRGLVATTSFGTYAAVLLHLIHRLAPHIPIISLDLGRNAETQAFARDLTARLWLTVHTYRIDLSLPAETTITTPERAVQQAKVAALEKALAEHGATAWMSGVQRHETERRKEFDFVMPRVDGLYKIHPLLDWDTRRLYAYCREFGLPINDHYYDPAKGADQKSECGIHLTGLANASFTASEL